MYLTDLSEVGKKGVPPVGLKDDGIDFGKLLSQATDSIGTELEKAAGKAAESAGQAAGEWAQGQVDNVFGNANNPAPTLPPEFGGTTVMPPEPNVEPGAIDNVVLNVNPVIAGGVIGGGAYALAKRPIVAFGAALATGLLVHMRQKSLLEQSGQIYY